MISLKVIALSLVVRPPPPVRSSEDKQRSFEDTVCVVDREGEDSRSGIQVIARAANILRALKSQHNGLSLGQLAERVSLPRSTVQRIVAALQEERLLMSAGPDKGIRLGPELQALAAAAKIDIAEVLRPHLIDVSRATTETVDLALVRNDKLLFLDQVAGSQRLRTVSFVGDVFPMTTTANGKACLALMADSEVTRIALAEMSGRNASSRVAALLAELQIVRATGMAFDEDEHTLGISAVGIAFRDAQGSLYAVSVPSPTARLQKNRTKIVAALGDLAARIDELIRSTT